MKRVEKRENPGHGTLHKAGPGLYSLPEELGVRPVQLTQEYKDFTRRMRALTNPIAYLRAIMED